MEEDTRLTLTVFPFNMHLLAAFKETVLYFSLQGALTFNVFLVQLSDRSLAQCMEACNDMNYKVVFLQRKQSEKKLTYMYLWFVKSLRHAKVLHIISLKTEKVGEQVNVKVMEGIISVWCNMRHCVLCVPRGLIRLS